jgi:hypothetical protein
MFYIWESLKQIVVVRFFASSTIAIGHVVAHPNQLAASSILVPINKV